MNIKQKIFSAGTIGAMVLSLVAPSAFASGITISHNGDFSHNHVGVISWSNHSVSQTNVSENSTAVMSFANTGGNLSAGNTGGTNSIRTGNVTTTSTVTNSGSENVNTGDCGCSTPATPPTVTIENNGDFSSNHVFVFNGSSNTVTQTNVTSSENLVVTGANTGFNGSIGNTGSGNSISTGSVTTTSTVTNGGSVNEN